MVQLARLDKTRHRQLMLNILIDIYRDLRLGTSLGFKGGTACFFIYSMDRFSTDLDFDLIGSMSKEEIFEKMKNILGKYGAIKNAYIKANTIFLMLSYGLIDHNIKVEISTRNNKSSYEKINWNSLSILIMKREDIFANKVCAFLGRKNIANRDIFDIHFFLKNNWNINESLLKKLIGKKFSSIKLDMINKIEGLGASHRILEGLGNLLQDEKQKNYIKNFLLKDIVFLLKNI